MNTRTYNMYINNMGDYNQKRIALLISQVSIQNMNNKFSDYRYTATRDVNRIGMEPGRLKLRGKVTPQPTR